MPAADSPARRRKLEPDTFVQIIVLSDMISGFADADSDDRLPHRCESLLDLGSFKI